MTAISVGASQGAVWRQPCLSFLQRLRRLQLFPKQRCWWSAFYLTRFKCVLSEAERLWFVVLSRRPHRIGHVFSLRSRLGHTLDPVPSAPTVPVRPRQQRWRGRPRASPLGQTPWTPWGVNLKLLPQPHGVGCTQPSRLSFVPSQQRLQRGGLAVDVGSRGRQGAGRSTSTRGHFWSQ